MILVAREKNENVPNIRKPRKSEDAQNTAEFIKRFTIKVIQSKNNI